MDSSLWLVACGVGALLVRVGLALYAAGMMRAKNAAGIMVRHVVDLSLAVLAFWLIGGALLGAAPGQAVAWQLIGRTSENASPFLFFAVCATLIATGIVVGVAAERSRFFSMSLLAILLGGVIVPIAWRWIGTGGWLGRLGYRDLAGAAVIHWVGALCALLAAILVGPRSGKYNRDGSATAIPGHNLPLASAGLLLVIVGWFPYILGFLGVDLGTHAAPVGQIAMNTLLAAAAGLITSLLFSNWKYLKPDIHLAYAGLLGALVAISAAADLGSGWVAVVVGAVAGLMVPLGTILLDLLWHIDDPTGAVTIHGLGGAWGVLAAGIFAGAESFLGKVQLIGVQMLGLVAIGLLTLALSGALLLILKRTIGLRSKEADEFDGLDLAEHDIGAYPDFQQTMIKSYHLREA